MENYYRNVNRTFTKTLRTENKEEEEKLCGKKNSLPVFSSFSSFFFILSRKGCEMCVREKQKARCEWEKFDHVSQYSSSAKWFEGNGRTGHKYGGKLRK